MARINNSHRKMVNFDQSHEIEEGFSAVIDMKSLKM